MSTFPNPAEFMATTQTDAKREAEKNSFSGQTILNDKEGSMKNLSGHGMLGEYLIRPIVTEGQSSPFRTIRESMEITYIDQFNTKNDKGETIERKVSVRLQDPSDMRGGSEEDHRIYSNIYEKIKIWSFSKYKEPEKDGPLTYGKIKTSALGKYIPTFRKTGTVTLFYAKLIDAYCSPEGYAEVRRNDKNHPALKDTWVGFDKVYLFRVNNSSFSTAVQASTARFFRGVTDEAKMSEDLYHLFGRYTGQGKYLVRLNSKMIDKKYSVDMDFLRDPQTEFNITQGDLDIVKNLTEDRWNTTFTEEFCKTVREWDRNLREIETKVFHNTAPPVYRNPSQAPQSPQLPEEDFNY